jgi:23S rRNA pseudouridine1911/1915/1917 synthase
MLTHPSCARFYGSLAGICAGYFKSSGQDVACHVVNRLDRDTSGIVVIAKSAHYKTVLAKALHEEEAEKKYTAVLYSTLTPAEGTIDAPIIREEEQKMKRIVSPDGQRAVTDYRIIKTASVDGEEISLAEFVLKTGRTHQIRVHSSYMGAPLLGDVLYGNDKSIALSRKLNIDTQLLHAGSLRFKDPISGATLNISAPIERENMCNLLGKYFD